MVCVSAALESVQSNIWQYRYTLHYKCEISTKSHIWAAICHV